MKTKTHIWIGTFILCCITFMMKGQSLLNITDSIQKNNKTDTKIVYSTWKDTRLINAQTSKTPPPKTMVFRIMHRFGDAGTSGGGFHTLYGFDVASDIYFSFEFGITKNLEVGFGRSMMQELIDVMAKYRFLTQNNTGMPVSLALYEDAGVTPELSSILYAGGNPSTQPFSDRLSYISQLMLDRRFNDRFSVELFSGLSHRNYVLAEVNPNNGAVDQTNIPYAGIGGRIALNKHSAIVLDYYYVISTFRSNNNPSYSNPFSVGYEVETGGHVFEINFSNASFINENNLIPYTTGSWGEGAFKLGFSISRAFNI